jgi:hypothetical protein
MGYVVVLLVGLNSLERVCTIVTGSKDEIIDGDEMKTIVMQDVILVIPIIKKHTKENTQCIW